MAILLDNNAIENILKTDLQTNTSTLAIFFNQFDTFEQAMHDLSNISKQISKYDLERILHGNINNLQIPFNTHIIYMCYKKYGIECCDILLKQYFNNNRDFYILNIEPDITITHLEHYRKHEKTMKIVRELREKNK